MILEAEVIGEVKGGYAGKRGHVDTYSLELRGMGASSTLLTYVEYQLVGDEQKAFGTYQGKRVRVVVRRIGDKFKDFVRLEGDLTLLDSSSGSKAKA